MRRFLFLSFSIMLCFFSAACFASANKLYNAQTFSLKNGLVVYLIENHRIPVVSHMVVYRVGSADDPRGKSGLAHFLEHMMFKGPKGSPPERLMGDAEKIGGSVNASTGFDVTSYYEIVPKEHVEHFMKLEASRMRDLPTRLEDSTPEIQVVLEEENMRLGNNPLMQFYTALRAAFFRHHPYGTHPIGLRNEIKSYKPDDVKNFHQRFYAPDNAFIILSGDLTLSEAKDLIEKHYGDIPAIKHPQRKRVKEPFLDSIIQVTRLSDKVAHPYVAMIFPAPTYDTKNPVTSDALDLAIYALSNNATGIIYRRLVEKLKVATSFSLSYEPLDLDDATITIIAHAAPDITHIQLEQAIHDEIKKIIDAGLTDQQLEQFKTQTLSGLDYLKDSLLGGADHLVAPLIKGVPLQQIETWPEAVKSLKLQDVNDALKKHFSPKHYVVGYLLPEKKVEPVTVSEPISLEQENNTSQEKETKDA